MCNRDEFEYWADEFDHSSVYWKDMGRDEIFMAGMRAARAQQAGSGEVEPAMELDISEDRRFSPILIDATLSLPAGHYELYTHPPAKVPEAREIVDRVVVELEAGFVACRRCGDQEDTSTLDCMADLKRLQALLTTPTPATTPQPADKCSAWPCWNCKSKVSMDERGEADGDCPKCGAELDLDLWPAPPQEQ